MIEIVSGDITTLDIAGIENAANSMLLRGGGVCGAIHRVSGGNLQKFLSEMYDGCPPGEARISPGFNCSAKYQIQSHALPVLGCGVYGYPIKSATQIALESAQRYMLLQGQDTHIVFCCFDDVVFRTYQTLLERQA